jgi:hypothetical protein
MSNKLKLQDHATDLQAILDTINALPEANADIFAFIAVTYPAGSTLTCTDGVKTLTAETTIGSYVFCVPYAATWIVTATDPADSTNTKSKTVEITIEGQLEVIDIVNIILWGKGSEYNTDITGGFYSVNSVTISDIITLTGEKTYYGSGSNYWSGSAIYCTNQKVTITNDFNSICN